MLRGLVMNPKELKVSLFTNSEVEAIPKKNVGAKRKNEILTR